MAGVALQQRQSFLRTIGGSSGTTNDENVWEALCPELFALILKAVQKNAGREASEARRVVALAGVCRRWRHLIQQSYSSPLAEFGLLQFPFALRQPGPLNRPVHCLLKHKGSTFVLFQQSISSGKGGGAATDDQKLDFLMGAQREWRAGGSCFAISADHRCFSKSGHAYMGKLQSDFWGEEFNLWEVSGSLQNRKRRAIRISFSDCGLHRRAMTCELFAMPSRWHNTLSLPASTVPAVVQRQPSSSTEPIHQRIAAIAFQPYFGPSLFSCFLSLPYNSRPKTPKAAPTFLRSYSSLRRANYSEQSNSKATQLARSASARHSKELGITLSSQNPMIMESKAPHWDEQSQRWSLDFNGRALLPSPYSFQLVQPSNNVDAPTDNINAQQARHRPTVNDQNAEDHHTVFLQLGKVSKGLYTVDFCHPLSAFQAFSICLSSFASKVGVYP